MNRLIVGEEGCSVKDIVLSIRKSASARLLVQNWWKLAAELATPENRLVELENDLLKSQKGVLDVVANLLVDWSELEGSNAKFSALLEILDEKCGWKEMADNLRENFRQKITNHTTWNDLDEASKHQILDRMTLYFGKKKSLKEVLSVFDEEEQTNLLNRALSGPLVRQMLDTGPPIHLTRSEKAATPDYYITRYFSSRTVINPKIFLDKNCSDIFVIGGVSFSQLTNFTGAHQIDRSSSQVTSLSVRFIILEFKQDFEKICLISDVSAVHLLVRRNERFYWRKTHGSLAMIQQYMADEKEQETVSESAFWGDRLAEYADSSSSLLICGGSGSGKSTLLRNLYLKRKKRDSGAPMILASFSALFDCVDDDKSSQVEILCRDDAIRLISRFVSDNDIGKEIVVTLLEHDAHSFDIFLDDFDLIQEPDKLLVMTEFLIILTTEFQNVKLFVTTAPQKRQELEETMGQLALELMPFQQLEQALFMEQYWHHKVKIQAPNQNVIQKFASSLASTFVDVAQKCKQVADIPLQCTMLAEIYSGDAIKHTKNPTLDFAVLLKVNSIFDMYKWLITKRFHKIGDDELRQRLTDMHVVLALAFLFPHLPLDISEVMGLSSTLACVEEINSIGIVQSEDVLDEGERVSNGEFFLEFGHRTYAEYLLANFLINILDEPPPDDAAARLWEDAMAELLFRNIMVCIPVVNEVQIDSEDHLSSCFSPMTFRHFSICLFLNGCLGDTQEFRVALKAVHVSKLLLSIPSMVLIPQRICDILNTCIVHGFYNLFRLIAPFCLVLKSVVQQAIDQVSWQNMLFMATKYASLEFVEECCGFVELLLGVEIDQVTVFNEKMFQDTFVFNPLDVSISRGDVHVFNFILEKFESRISEQIGLLHQCVQFSREDSEEIIDGKLRIVSILLGINRDMLDEKEPVAETVPVLARKIHWRLLERLILEGADVTAVTKDEKDTVAHKAARTMTPEEFDKFCQLIVGEKKLGDIFQKKNARQETALHIVLGRMQINPSTLSLLCSELKLNLNNSDGEEMTELFCAVAGHQSKAILEIILQFGGSLKHLGKNNQTVLHVAAVHGNVTALEYFISLGCKINARDSSKCTPLHLILSSGGKNLDEIIVAAVKHKADLYAADNRGSTPMATAMSSEHVWKLDTDTVSLLKKSEVKKGFWNCFRKSK